jgi:hypothetical protein
MQNGILIISTASLVRSYVGGSQSSDYITASLVRLSSLKIDGG